MSGLLMFLAGAAVLMLGLFSILIAAEKLEKSERPAIWLCLGFAGCALILASLGLSLVGIIRYFQYLWSVTA